MNFNAAHIFTVVVEKGSFSAASKELRIPLTTVSRRVSQLEESVGVRLLERTTRSLRVTDAGHNLYQAFSRGFEEINTGLTELVASESNLKGRIRVSLPPAMEICWPFLQFFKNQYPNIEIDTFITTHKLDLIDSGFDVAFRVGEVNNLSSICRRLLTYRHILIASPSIAPITSIEDLAFHPCIAWGYAGDDIVWSLGGRSISVEPKAISNDYQLLKHNTLNGSYVTELPPFLCSREIETGLLNRVLVDYPLPKLDLNIVYPSRKQQSRITQLFIDASVEYFRVNYKDSV